MDIQWWLLLKNGWPIFWVTTLYSYFSCAVVGITTGVKTKGDKEKINKKLESFIISPFYIATFFCLLAILYFWKGIEIFHHVGHLPLLHMLIMGLMVFVGHLCIEVIESTLIWKNPMRILEDKDAIRLCGIYLLVIIQTMIVALFVL